MMSSLGFGSKAGRSYSISCGAPSETLRRSRSGKHVFVIGIRPSIADILHDRAMQQRDILRDHGNRRPETLLSHARNVLAVNNNAPLFHVVEPLQLWKTVTRRIAAPFPRRRVVQNVRANLLMTFRE